MKKTVSVFLLLLTFFAVFGLFSYISIVSAATFEARHEQVTLENGNPAVTITVKSTKLDEISVTVYKTGAGPEQNPVTSGNVQSIFVYANQKTTNEQGIATFTFETGENFPEGEYCYSVFSNTANSILNPIPTFQYYSIESINQAFADLYNLRLLNDETQKIKKVYELIDENSERFRVKTPLYLKFSERDKMPENALLSVLGKKYTFTTIDEFTSRFYENLCIDAIICLRDYDDMLLLYDDSSELSIVEDIGLGTTGTEQDIQRYKKFTEMSDSSKKKVFKEIDNLNPDSAETFMSVFSKAVFMTELDNAVNWEMIDQLILNHSELLGSLGDTYYALNDSRKKAAICQELFKLISSNNFKSVSDFSLKLGDLLENGVPSTGQDPTIITGNPGSGGGGGGSAAIKVEVPSKPVQTENEPAKKIHLFEDIDDVAWAKEAIDVLYAKDVINGRSETVFAPNDNVTREEFVKMACELFGFTNNQATSSFEDVSPDDWFYHYVASAQERGLVNGISESMFGSRTPLTRQDLVTFAYRFAIAANVDFNNKAPYIPFYDHNLVADYAKEALQTLASCEIVSGKEGNLFYPKEYCTRAETAKILYGIYKNLY